MLQTSIPVRVANPLETLSQLKVVASKTRGDNIGQEESKPKEVDGKTKQVSGDKIMSEPTLFVAGMGRTLAVVEIEIMGHQLTLVDRGSGVNMLLEETWRVMAKPTLWPPTFHLVGAH